MGFGKRFESVLDWFEVEDTAHKETVKLKGFMIDDEEQDCILYKHDLKLDEFILRVTNMHNDILCRIGKSRNDLVNFVDYAEDNLSSDFYKGITLSGNYYELIEEKKVVLYDLDEVKDLIFYYSYQNSICGKEITDSIQVNKATCNGVNCYIMFSK